MNNKAFLELRNVVKTSFQYVTVFLKILKVFSMSNKTEGRSVAPKNGLWNVQKKQISCDVVM